MTIYQCDNCFFVFSGEEAQCPACNSKRVDSQDELEEDWDGETEEITEADTPIGVVKP